MERIFALSTAVVLAGCAPLPQTADEFRNSDNVLLTKSSTMVARSPARVSAAIQKGAQRCLNTQESQHIAYSTGYSRQTRRITADYDATIKRGRGGRGELSIYRVTSGAYTPGSDNGGFMAYVVDVVPSGGQTRLDIYGGKVYYGDLNKAVLEWAKGGPLRCPAMP